MDAVTRYNITASPVLPRYRSPRPLRSPLPPRSPAPPNKIVSSKTQSTKKGGFTPLPYIARLNFAHITGLPQALYTQDKKNIFKKDTK